MLSRSSGAGTAGGAYSGEPAASRSGQWWDGPGRRGPEGDDALRAQPLREGIDGIDHREVVPVDDQEPGVRVLEHIAQLARGIAIVDGHHHRAEGRKGEPGDGIGGDIRQHDRDVRALADSDSRERVGEAPHLLPRPGEGEAFALFEVVQELSLPEALHRGIEQCAHGLGKGAPLHFGVPGADLFRSSHDSPFRHDYSRGREYFHPALQVPAKPQGVCAEASMCSEVPRAPLVPRRNRCSSRWIAPPTTSAKRLP